VSKYETIVLLFVLGIHDIPGPAMSISAFASIISGAESQLVMSCVPKFEISTFGTPSSLQFLRLFLPLCFGFLLMRGGRCARAGSVKYGFDGLRPRIEIKSLMNGSNSVGLNLLLRFLSCQFRPLYALSDHMREV
jgi:hypothetical protein